MKTILNPLGVLLFMANGNSLTLERWVDGLKNIYSGTTSHFMK